MRYVGVVLGLICVAFVGVLTVTPLVWDAMGRPNNTYPELGYLMFGLPVAAILFAYGVKGAMIGTASIEARRVHFFQWSGSVIVLFVASIPLWQN